MSFHTIRTTLAPAVYEVWSTHGKGRVMTLDSGVYGDNESFRMLSEDTEFARGDGLPGMAWATEAPVVLDRVRVSNFARAESGRPIGLTAGIGLPVFFDDQVQSVMTVLTAYDSTQFICEVWRPDHQNSELVLRDGFYGKLQRFSDVTKFPFGQGLPGLVWQTGCPLIIEDLGNSPLFCRSKDAQREGLSMGVGFPVHTRNATKIVILMSSNQRPLFRACEIWKVAGGKCVPEFVQGAYGTATDLMPSPGSEQLIANGSVASETLATGTPLVTEDLRAIEPHRARQLADAGVTIGVGYPIYSEGALEYMVVLFC